MTPFKYKNKKINSSGSSNRVRALFSHKANRKLIKCCRGLILNIHTSATTHAIMLFSRNLHFEMCNDYKSLQLDSLWTLTRRLFENTSQLLIPAVPHRRAGGHLVPGGT